MSDWIDKEIAYTHDHKCVPNGVGDYELSCPTLGTVPGFVPFMYRTLIDGCACGLAIALIPESDSARSPSNESPKDAND